MNIEFTKQELGLLQGCLRKTAIHFWGEAEAARQMNPGDDMDVSIVRMFMENAEKMKALFLKMKAIEKEMDDQLSATFSITKDELATLSSSMKEPIVELLGETTLYNIDRYWLNDNKEFRRVMAIAEGRSAVLLLNLCIKLRKCSE